MTNKELGYAGEKAVSIYLEKKGYKIVKQNFCIKGGEVDIIAAKNNILAFVEVKTRKKDALVKGLQAISKNKIKRIIKSANAYINKFDEEIQVRFDVASIEVCENKVTSFEYIENAFDASDIII